MHHTANQAQPFTYLHPSRSNLLSMNRQATSCCHRVTTSNHVFYRSLKLCEKQWNRLLFNIDFGSKMPSFLQECNSQALGWFAIEQKYNPNVVRHFMYAMYRCSLGSPLFLRNTEKFKAVNDDCAAIFLFRSICQRSVFVFTAEIQAKLSKAEMRVAVWKTMHSFARRKSTLYGWVGSSIRTAQWTCFGLIISSPRLISEWKLKGQGRHAGTALIVSLVTVFLFKILWSSK